MRTSFVLYTSYIEQFQLLTDEQAGALIKAIFAYEAEEEAPVMDGAVKMAFSFIKSHLDADAEKYEATCEKRRAAGRQGGRPPKAEDSGKNQKNQMVPLESKKSIRAPDHVNDLEFENDPESDSVIDVGKESALTDTKEKSAQEQAFDEFWAVYPKKKSKGRARTAWLKLKPDESVIAAIMAKIPELKKTTEWQTEGGRYIPYPATWLNAEGWNDEALLSQPQTIRRQGSFGRFPQREYDYAALSKELFKSEPKEMQY